MKYSFVVGKSGYLLDLLCESLDVDRVLVKRQIDRGECKINGVRQKHNEFVASGSEIAIFVPQSFLEGGKVVDWEQRIKYRDQKILVFDKPQGMEIVKLQALVQANLGAEWVLTHRIDQNTAGLVLMACGETHKRQIVSAMNQNKIKKTYFAKVHGVLQGSGVLTVYLFKDAKKSVVYVSSVKKTGYKEAVTKYTVQKIYQNCTDVILELVTGRTHQIRATMAHFGHFVLGDGKYGINQINKGHGYKYQQLKAIGLQFGDLAEPFAYMNGQSIATGLEI